MLERNPRTPPPIATVPHESAHNHVSGEAAYIDDLAEPRGMLHAYIGLSSHAHAEVVSADYSAVLAAPGVVGIVTAIDIPGINDVSPAALNDDVVLVDRQVSYHGQPLFAVVATTREAARYAARIARIEYRALPPLIDVDDARANGGKQVGPNLHLSRGEVVQGLANAQRRVSGRMDIGGQEHFYLEGQVATATPGEDGQMVILSASQHPSDVQEIAARVLGLPANAVRVEVRRMGGGFGGKETQPAVFATIAALAARKFHRPVKIRPDRNDDISITGKRHDFVVDYDVGYDATGRIEAVKAMFAARCGHSTDCSIGVTDRALMHADNAYFYPHVEVTSELLRTNTVSNTAFRGYGGPQGMIACERWIEDIAYALGEDPLEIRKRNFYAEGRSLTPYHQDVHDNVMARIVAQLEGSSEYQRRRAAVLERNRHSEFVKYGIALVPVKFGISFSKLAMNQAGVLLTIYRDGSVHLNHGGTEMGQGIHTKLAQILADELSIDLHHIKVTATATDKVPNASPTAGSLGTDLNGMATVDAARQIRERLIDFAVSAYGVPADAIHFERNALRAGNTLVPWHELIHKAWFGRVQLHAAGFYKTPHITWDRKAGRGSPYLYFTYGASCSEVAVDTLTGEYIVLRTDILQDIGHSINRSIDLGQIEGGFMQGLGWLTTEELWWDQQGRLRTHAPSTYKIPLASDRPRVFNVELAEWSVNAAPTVHRSKAVGEPPVMLALSVFSALGMAAASVADYRFAPRLNAPATPERMLLEMERLKKLAPDPTPAGRSEIEAGEPD
ncbi:MAG: xanthine dehydrogenase molybdopterin binding subunit [Devosia sp.]|nr:xanthine dehydrogenase molybdopterin binding subunit [Devosia sp.]